MNSQVIIRKSKKRKDKKWLLFLHDKIIYTGDFHTVSQIAQQLS
jgi:hypothetical protein